MARCAARVAQPAQHQRQVEAEVQRYQQHRREPEPGAVQRERHQHPGNLRHHLLPQAMCRI
jgi:hypothetical protein